MPRSKLPLSFRRLPPNDHRLAVDAIIVDPGSSGYLHLPGNYASDAPPPAYRWKVRPPGEAGIVVTSSDIGTPAEYVVRIDVQNQREVPSSVELFWIKAPDLR